MIWHCDEQNKQASLLHSRKDRINLTNHVNAYWAQGH